MSRVCSRCGRPGHNKRTCPAELAGKPKAPTKPVKKAEPEPDEEDEDDLPPSRPIGEGLDAETVEAIEWYMEKNYPGWIERQKAKKAK
jgi:hypothetical protein